MMVAPVIYLDNLATTRIAPEVLSEMLPWLDEEYGNASSGTHSFGWRAADAAESARVNVAALIGAQHPAEITFTSGATESNNLVLKAVSGALDGSPTHFITTEIEHPSVLQAAEYLQRCGDVSLTIIRPESDGRVQAEDVAKAIRPTTRLISVMVVNNEVGTLQPVADIGRIARDANVLFHVDAAQAIAKTEFDVNEISADFASFSAHKLYGPKGIGALYTRVSTANSRLVPLLHGGGQEGGLRSGTLPVAQIVGFGAAARLAAREWQLDLNRIAALSLAFVDRLAEIDGFHLNGSLGQRVPNCINFSCEGVLSDALIAAVPNLAISSGSACSSHHGGGSHVLQAMALDEGRQTSAIRIGLGKFTTPSEVDVASKMIIAAVKRLRAGTPARSIRQAGEPSNLRRMDI